MTKPIAHRVVGGRSLLRQGEGRDEGFDDLVRRATSAPTTHSLLAVDARSALEARLRAACPFPTEPEPSDFAAHQLTTKQADRRRSPAKQGVSWQKHTVV